MAQLEMPDRDFPVERGVLSEAAHPLKRDSRLVAARGANGRGRPRDGEQVVQADLRRQRRLRVPPGRIAAISRAEPKLARAMRFSCGSSGSSISSQSAFRPANPARVAPCGLK